MFKDKNQFNLFVKEMNPVISEQVLRETIADACLKGGNTLRNLMDSYSVFLKSGDFNMNMRDFEKGLSEFLIPAFMNNMMVYESSRLGNFSPEEPVEAMESFNILACIRENVGQDNLFNVFQDGIKSAHSWLN